MKKAIKTINCCAKVPHQALQLMLLVNALDLSKGDDDAMSDNSSWMRGFLSLLTAFGCALMGILFFDANNVAQTDAQRDEPTICCRTRG